MTVSIAVPWPYESYLLGHEWIGVDALLELRRECIHHSILCANTWVHFHQCRVEASCIYTSSHGRPPSTKTWHYSKDRTMIYLDAASKSLPAAFPHDGSTFRRDSCPKIVPALKRTRRILFRGNKRIGMALGEDCPGHISACA